MEDFAFLQNATADFDALLMNGDPSPPLSFGELTAGVAERVDAAVFNPSTQLSMTVSNIIYQAHPNGRPPDRAYWVGRTLKPCIFGVVKECTILSIRNDMNVPFEVTSGKAAVKVLLWERIRNRPHVEDPLKEIAAMQHINQSGAHRNVLSVLDVLQDEEYLLLFMPFCASGDLFGLVNDNGRFLESTARYWFKQILEGLAHLQRMGVCHRDMSLENMLVDDHDALIIDFGMCLRVPFSTEDGSGAVSDVSAGTLRRLILPQVPCGKPNYIAPEVLRSTDPFDGFAIDLWGAAVILFIMVVGLPPWEFARPEDPRYRMIVKGGLASMLHSWRRDVSPLVADLLQRMLREDPRDRLSLEEVRDHEWVNIKDDEGSMPESSLDEGWRH